MQRALGLLMVDSALIVGWGKTFFASAGSPYESGRNLGTKSRRLDTWVSKFSQRPGQTSFLSQKTGVLVSPIKHPFLNPHHVLATTERSYAKKKVPFSQINCSLLADLGCFFGRKKQIFCPFSTFWQNENEKTSVFL